MDAIGQSVFADPSVEKRIPYCFIVLRLERFCLGGLVKYSTIFYSYAFFGDLADMDYNGAMGLKFGNLNFSFDTSC